MRAGVQVSAGRPASGQAFVSEPSENALAVLHVDALRGEERGGGGRVVWFTWPCIPPHPLLKRRKHLHIFTAVHIFPLLKSRLLFITDLEFDNEECICASA